jgi:AmmeMemoRadiSam system protein B
MFERPHRMRHDLAALVGVRPPAMAGRFYPEQASVLRRQVDRLVREAENRLDPPRGLVKAVIAPHAGYAYSGPIAASAFAGVALAAGVERVVVIGPSHYETFAGVALPASAALAIPGGRLPLDREAAAALLALDTVTVNPHAHDREHALEVELPFVLHLWGEVSVVPLVVGDASVGQVAHVLETIWGGPETRIVISSDLSHFLSYTAAQQADAATAEIIEKLGGSLTANQACGARAIEGFLCVARARGLSVARLDLRNSGDTAGDRERVVGYGAWRFCVPSVSAPPINAPPISVPPGGSLASGRS